MSKTAKKYVDFFVQVVFAMVVAEIEQIFFHVDYVDYGTIVAVILGSLGLLQALDLKYKVKND